MMAGLKGMSFGNFGATLQNHWRKRRSRNLPSSNDLATEADSRFTQAERFAIRSLDGIRANKLRRTLGTNYETSRRARETADRLHAATGFDAQEHYELSLANAARQAERAAEIIVEILHNPNPHESDIREILLKKES